METMGKVYEFTIRTLMLKVDMTYEGAYSLVTRMRKKGLVKDLGMTTMGSKNAKLYGLLMEPKQYLKEERNKTPSAPPPVGFYNNPFDLKDAKDARYNP
jgi:hypothetical protein